MWRSTFGRIEVDVICRLEHDCFAMVQKQLYRFHLCYTQIVHIYMYM
jgi:hypothetical protein